MSIIMSSVRSSVDWSRALRGMVVKMAMSMRFGLRKRLVLKDPLARAFRQDFLDQRLDAGEKRVALRGAGLQARVDEAFFPAVDPAKDVVVAEAQGGVAEQGLQLEKSGSESC